LAHEEIRAIITALGATLADVLMARAAGSMSLPQLRGRLAS